jgi:hypothetical protein
MGVTVLRVVHVPCVRRTLFRGVIMEFAEKLKTVTRGVREGSLALVTLPTAAVYVRRIRAKTVSESQAKRVRLQRSVYETQGTATQTAGRVHEAASV